MLERVYVEMIASIHPGKLIDHLLSLFPVALQEISARVFKAIYTC